MARSAALRLVAVVHRCSLREMLKEGRPRWRGEVGRGGGRESGCVPACCSRRENREACDATWFELGRRREGEP